MFDVMFDIYCVYENWNKIYWMNLFLYVDVFLLLRLTMNRMYLVSQYFLSIIWNYSGYSVCVLWIHSVDRKWYKSVTLLDKALGHLWYNY